MILTENMAGHSGDACRTVPASMVNREVAAMPRLPLDRFLPQTTPAKAGGFSLTLPIPPSLNSTTKNIRSRRAPTKIAVDWRRAAALHIADADVEPICDGKYVTLLLLPTAMHGDADNRVKIVNDLLVTLKLVPDDRHADVMAFRHPTIGDGLCRVLVKSVNPADRSGVAVAQALLASLPGKEREATT